LLQSMLKSVSTTQLGLPEARCELPGAFAGSKLSGVGVYGPVVSAEATRPTDHPEALDYFFRGRAALHKGPGRESFAEAISLTEHALALDPRSVEPQQAPCAIRS
jgi:hypothetical protein